MDERKELLEKKIQEVKNKHGFIEPKSLWAAIISSLEYIILNDGSLKRVVTAQRKYRKFTPAQARRLEEIIRSVFPVDFFKKRAHAQYAGKDPDYWIKRAEVKKLDTQLTLKLEDT